MEMLLDPNLSVDNEWRPAVPASVQPFSKIDSYMDLRDWEGSDFMNDKLRGDGSGASSTEGYIY